MTEAMMRLAPTRNFIDHATAGGGLLLRMRAWFTRSATASNLAACEPCDVVLDNVGLLDGPAALTPNLPQRTAVVLPFPIRGEALLVKLAEQLRNRIAGSAARDSFHLTIMPRPHLRLTIDAAAHVEFHAERATYHLVIELVQDTRIKIESTDFDIVVKFIAQYVADRLSGEHAAETAS
jgi:hypothetical protein